MEEVKKELEDLMNAVMVTFYGMMLMDEGNQQFMEQMEDDEANEQMMAMLFGPLIPRITDLMVKLAFSGMSEEEMEQWNPTSVFTVNKDEFVENFGEHADKAEQFMKSTSKENLIVIAQVVKATAELNGIVNDEEQKAIDEFCQEYGITSEELMGSNDDAAWLESFMNSNDESVS
jgi:uncharacterized membrane protein YebE (DUF533 family)